MAAVNYLERNPQFVAVLPCEVDTIKLRKTLQYVEKMSTEFFILGCSILSADFELKHPSPGDAVLAASEPP